MFYKIIPIKCVLHVLFLLNLNSWNAEAAKILRQPESVSLDVNLDAEFSVVVEVGWSGNDLNLIQVSDVAELPDVGRNLVIPNSKSILVDYTARHQVFGK